MTNAKASPTLVMHFLGAATCVALLIVGYWVGIRPAAAEQSTDADLRIELSNAQADLRARENELEKIRSQAARLEREGASRSLVLQPTSYLNPKLGEIATLGETCGLRIDKTRVGPLEAASDHRYFQIDLGGIGPLAGVAELLGRVHLEHPDIAIQMIDLIRDPSTGNARFELKLLWFVAEATQSTASAETAPAE